ncbi:hypothetical protein SH591_00555 [Sphingomonas sp. LY54]|uniref:hypothetical protein n=1 Tax=Sphingomonas sp. LY54 TaxID=3095343 RepID=UPI002D7A0F61|nr:hypothetical protein [Sphingomonas sp. LY54]WRP28714.1 hypothetical protein SH591_00555 [Sphingomonas sp. LY54]
MSGQISDVFGMLKRDGQRAVTIEEMNKVIGGGDDDHAADRLRIQTLAEYASADRDERDNGLRKPRREPEE